MVCKRTQKHRRRDVVEYAAESATFVGEIRRLRGYGRVRPSSEAVWRHRELLFNDVRKMRLGQVRYCSPSIVIESKAGSSLSERADFEFAH
jgi:hypothetical protein